MLTGSQSPDFTKREKTEIMKCRFAKLSSLIGGGVGGSGTAPINSGVKFAIISSLGFSSDLFSVLKNSVFMLDVFYFVIK